MIVAPLALGVLLAQAQPVVVVRCEERIAPCEAVRAITWGAYLHQVGVAPRILELADDLPAGTDRVLQLDVVWVPREVEEWRSGYMGVVPMVSAVEYRVEGARWHAERHWDTLGAHALFRTAARPQDVFSLPQVALEETLTRSLAPVERQVPSSCDDCVEVPLEVAVDEAYATRYGSDWRSVAAARVAAANAVLAPAGIHLDIRSLGLWHAPAGVDDMSELLDAFAAQVASPTGIALGFTLREDLARSWEGELDDIGRAYRPGQHALVADQAAIPGSELFWDELGDGSAIAHELLHTLGVPHQERPLGLMSARRQWLSLRMDQATVELARVAAQARFGDSDLVVSTQELSRTAEAYLADPAAQAQYVLQNSARSRPATER